MELNLSFESSTSVKGRQVLIPVVMSTGKKNSRNLPGASIAFPSSLKYFLYAYNIPIKLVLIHCNINFTIEIMEWLIWPASVLIVLHAWKYWKLFFYFCVAVDRPYIFHGKFCKWNSRIQLHYGCPWQYSVSRTLNTIIISCSDWCSLSHMFFVNMV